MKGGQAQHLAFLPVLVTLDNTRKIFKWLSKSLQRPGKLYYVTVYYAVIWVFKIPLSPWCVNAVGGDVDIVAGIMKLGEQVAGNTKLE
jgi:hypothetical protein